jgi:hypothetical protein
MHLFGRLVKSIRSLLVRSRLPEGEEETMSPDARKRIDQVSARHGGEKEAAMWRRMDRDLDLAWRRYEKAKEREGVAPEPRRVRKID